MLIWVGATSGYCAIGSEVIAPMPISMMMIAITQAKIGRSMNIFDIQPARGLGVAVFAPGGGAWIRCGAFCGTGLTGEPGMRFAMPWVITLSPFASPDVTIQ